MVSLEGVETRKGNRHAFVHERLYEIIERDTERDGVSCFTKRDAAEALGCDVTSIDRAVRRLRAEGAIESVPRYSATGAQLANAYRETSANR